MLLGAMASAMAFSGTRPAQASGPALRLAAIDWAMAETAMLLGHAPVAVAELPGLIAATEGIALPGLAGVTAGVVDLGLRGSPNLEGLSLVAPDLILSSGYYRYFEPQLSRVAPVFSRDLFVPGEPPLPKVLALIGDLSAHIGMPHAGQTAAAHAAERFAQIARRVRPHAGRPFLLMEIGDSRHIRAYGDDSLPVGVLETIGLTSAWRGGTRFSFAPPVPMEELVAYPDAHFVITSQVPVQVAQGLGRSALWNALPAVRAGRVTILPEINGFSGALSALRFGGFLADALEGQR